MKSSPGINELREGKQEFDQFFSRLWRQRMSRRAAVKLGTLAALGGVSGVSQFLAACAEEEKKAAETGTPGAGTPAAGTGTPFAGVTGDWDTTKTPPYKQGLPDDVAKVPAEWKQYPWIYKYHPNRYNWNVPVTRGGHLITSWAPPADYNVMVSGTAARRTNDSLYNAGLREGITLTTAGIEPDLAIKDEHSGDFTSWVITIPEGVKFHNIPPVSGREMTVEDVVYSMERHRDSSVFKIALRHIDKITAVDKTHIRFDLKLPQLNFPATLAQPHFVIFAKEHFENQDLFKKQAIGTGPYILEFSEYQNKSEHVRNPQYWQRHPLGGKYGNQPLPFIDKITGQFFANLIQAKTAFFAGQIDQYAPGCGVDPTLIREELQSVPNAILVANTGWSCCPTTILMNFKNPLFQDVRVRKALSMSIDREQIWSGGMDKTGLTGAGPVPLDLAGYTTPPPLKDLGPTVQSNPPEAKRLLQEAGYTPPPQAENIPGATATRAVFHLARCAGRCSVPVEAERSC